MPSSSSSSSSATRAFPPARHGQIGISSGEDDDEEIRFDQRSRLNERRNEQSVSLDAEDDDDDDDGCDLQGRLELLRLDREEEGGREASGCASSPRQGGQSQENLLDFPPPAAGIGERQRTAAPLFTQSPRNLIPTTTRTTTTSATTVSQPGQPETKMKIPLVCPSPPPPPPSPRRSAAT